MTLRLWLILGAVLTVLGMAAYIYHKGGADERAHQATEQLKHEKKVRKSYDKIDRATPFDADKRRALEWLRQYGRQQ